MEMVGSCPNCCGNELFTNRVTSGNTRGLYLLEGLGGFFHFAKFDVVVCADCGLTRFFAEPSAREKARVKWKPAN
jgi:predicted nucleic-acid-binding Zn-ribbon protein